MKPRLEREGDLLVLDLSGIGKTAFQDALAKVKAMEGRRYNPERKRWEFEAKPMTAHRLIHQVEAQPSSEVLAWVRAELAKQADEVVTQLPHVDRAALGYPQVADLYEHQVDAVGFLAEHPLSILADDMGLGKTVESIATVVEMELRGALDPARPKLVVSPASMMGKWAEEVLTWAPGAKVAVIDGRKPAPKRAALLREALATEGAWIIVNYEQVRAQKIKLTDHEDLRQQLIAEAETTNERASLRRRKYHWLPKEPLFARTKWSAVIADEAHRIKNRDAQQTRGMWYISAPVKLALTGTPVLNSPDELWSLLAWLRPDQYGEFSPYKIGYQQFFDNYVEYSEGYYGRIITGVKNADALRFELSDKLVRRTKGQVLDLPPKIRTIVPVELTPKQRKMYADAEHGLWVVIEEGLEALQGEARQRAEAAMAAGDVRQLAILIPNAAARVTRLRQIASSPALLGGPDESAKLDAAVEIITDHPEQPFVTFSEFKGTAVLLVNRLRKRKLRAEVLTGDTPPAERTRLVQAFQSGELDVLAATIDAGGVGLTLTRADTAIFTERDWTPGINEQAEDRLHRIGQDRSVNIIILEARGTVDDGRIAPKNAVKELIVSSVVHQDHITERRAA